LINSFRKKKKTQTQTIFSAKPIQSPTLNDQHQSTDDLPDKIGQLSKRNVKSRKKKFQNKNSTNVFFFFKKKQI